MKYSIFAYPVLAGLFCLTACTTEPEAAAPEAPEKVAVKAPEKPLTPAQKAVLERKKAAAEAAKRVAETKERIAAIDKKFKSFSKKVSYPQRIEMAKEFLKDPEFSADPAVRYKIYDYIISCCRMPGWTTIQCYDAKAADVELVPAAMAIINDKAIRNTQKVKTYSELAEYYAGIKDFKKAEAVAREAMTLKQLDKMYQAKTYLILANVYRWNEDYENYKKTIWEAMKIHPTTAASHGAAIAFRYGKLDDAAAFWKAANNLYAELLFYAPANPRRSNTHYGSMSMSPCDRTADARKFVMDTKNPAKQRFDIAAHYCMDTMEPEDVAARATLKGIPAKDKFSWAFPRNGGFLMAYGRGDYALAAELCELTMDTRYMEPVHAKMLYVSSLGACGRTADAIKVANEYIATLKLTDMEKLKFQCFVALLEGKDVMPVIKAAKRSNKEEYGIIRSVARQCLVWGKTAEAEKYAAEYQKYFAMPEKRVLTVKYFDTPIYSVADWRKIYSKLEKQYCNIPYRGKLDFFETDVATGSRNVTFDPAAKPLGATEITAAADRYGLHVFLRIEAENAREVEQGFAKAVSPECYFAPGHNQPYICFGPDPVGKSSWTFHTTYNNKGSTRLNEKQPARSYRIEYAFSDTDYVIHIFFGWENHYNKLPENGSEYLFEAIVWTPAGGMTWGGTQGPHGVSEWGRLRFDLNRKQLNEIRKEIIFKTYRNYKLIPYGGATGMGEDAFATWGAELIGDPEFYQQYLKPLQEKLEKYAKMVKKDMTDEEIEDVYVNALPLMKGLRYEVEDLRRKYLEEALMK